MHVLWVTPAMVEMLLLKDGYVPIVGTRINNMGRKVFAILSKHQARNLTHYHWYIMSIGVPQPKLAERINWRFNKRRG